MDEATRQPLHGVPSHRRIGRELVVLFSHLCITAGIQHARTRRVGGAGKSELERPEYADAGQCMPVAGALLSYDRPPRCSVFSLFSSSPTVFSPGESYPRMHVSSSIPTWYPSAIFSLQHIWRHRPSFISLPSAAAPSQLPQLFSGNVALLSVG